MDGLSDFPFFPRDFPRFRRFDWDPFRGDDFPFDLPLCLEPPFCDLDGADLPRFVRLALDVLFRFFRSLVLLFLTGRPSECDFFILLIFVVPGREGSSSSPKPGARP